MASNHLPPLRCAASSSASSYCTVTVLPQSAQTISEEPHRSPANPPLQAPPPLLCPIVIAIAAGNSPAVQVAVKRLEKRPRTSIIDSHCRLQPAPRGLITTPPPTARTLKPRSLNLLMGRSSVCAATASSPTDLQRRS